ncbi:galactofuranose ABC transporter, permease protein YjfF [Agarivorans sp. MS3-6]|uniref:galactofuranose ABC transporter, permease protein YjfF n=1 Tax=Agarivorans sp. TSD2052 TaxID=2937286 RepID=UPI00200FE584|nr:galactofuranose ABC transporter, permease protein YjfF [Agarivorans sp. TSD2052]UPW20131.1 sugar ABC transporter permease YjfF [Agarivorans sp. TSD2052]
MNIKYMPLMATIVVFISLYSLGSIQFDNFFSMRVFTNLFTDNAFLVITAIGMTFVILSGGIDLSVGSMIACVGVSVAVLIEHYNVHPIIAFTIILMLAWLFGGFMGLLIERYKLPPFIVTLAGMFFLRGLSFVISIESIPITHEFYDSIADFSIPIIGGGNLTVSSLIMFVVLAVAIYIAHYTRFGRNIYAIGGNEQSARLLGVPVAKTIINIYALNSLFAALGGIVFSFYTFSGYSLAAMGLELDAIASVVIGGTLLTGGVGFVAGTLFGVLIQGVIQTIISFDGTLNSWWTKIFIGLLLFVFIAMQRLLSSARMLRFLEKLKHRKLSDAHN